MLIERQSWELVDPLFKNKSDAETILTKIANAYGECYAADIKDMPAYLKGKMKLGHESPLEHGSVTVRLITDRGVLGQLTRHRIASYSVESSRYCNYAKDKFGGQIAVVLPVWFEHLDVDRILFSSAPPQNAMEEGFMSWWTSCLEAETQYMRQIRLGFSAEQARQVLPFSLKTAITLTMNIREYRHVFSLRCDPHAHPQFRALANSMLKTFHQEIPIVFDDLWEKYGD